LAPLLWRLQRLHGVSPGLGYRNLGLIGLGMAITGAVTSSIRSNAVAASSLAAVMASAVIVAMILIIPQLRHDIRATVCSLLIPIRQTGRELEG
jgi:hypothetical protein